MVASARLSSSLPLGARNSAMALLSSGVPHSRSSCATPRSYSSSRIPHGQSGAQRVRAIEPSRTSALFASRVRRREQDGHRAALGDADQRGALGPGGVHDRANVVHAGLEARRAADAI